VRPPTARAASEIIPWDVIGLDLRPFRDFYAFNPSVHYDPTDGVWRCVLRNCDYHAPGGVPVATRKKGGRITTRNVMAILDPVTWQPIAHYEMRELDGLVRNKAAGAHGFEDVRLFRTERDGLMGVASTMELRTDSSKQDIVLLRFDSTDDYAIVEAQPIRGGWSEYAQKNWAPFDGALGVRLLYSIERGLVFDGDGPIGNGGNGDGKPKLATGAGVAAAIPEPHMHVPARHNSGGVRYNGGVETRLTNRVVRADRAGDTPSAPAIRRSTDLGWLSQGLRGGSQLVALGDDSWLGIGHEMCIMHNRKFYWHTWYTCDNRGRLMARSGPMKLSGCGIEFAAGLALDPDGGDGDRLVCSFGTEDQDSWLGITSLDAVVRALVPLESTASPGPSAPIARSAREASP
jgi:hypothetical protein